MRGPKISKKKPKGVWRIAALGDSTMFGWGIREEETFPAVLQRALNSGSDSREYEVLNFAVPGYNTAMEAELVDQDTFFNHPRLQPV
jgi:lysophospholipase L1-like esterase